MRKLNVEFGQLRCFTEQNFSFGQFMGLFDIPYAIDIASLYLQLSKLRVTHVLVIESGVNGKANANHILVKPTTRIAVIRIPIQKVAECL